MARGDEIRVIGIDKVSRDLNDLLTGPKLRRKTVDRSSREALKPLLKEARNAAPIAEKDVPAWKHRDPIPRGTIRRAIKLRKRKSWLGLIISHGTGRTGKPDAWYWRFPEYGWVHWADGKFKNQHSSFGLWRRLMSGNQTRVLNKWLRTAQAQLRIFHGNADWRMK